MSQVARECALEGRSLVSVSVLDGYESDSDELERGVRSQLRGWFGSVLNERRALPRITPTARASPTEIGGVVACGDHLESASIQGAMLPGRRAAEAVIDRGDFPI
jgi:predicted NAD/FAD-dependent oxidoreductase